MSRKWTPEEDRWLAEVYHLLPTDQIAAKLGRTKRAVRQHANKVLLLSLKVSGLYTIPEVAKALGVSRPIVRDYIAQGWIKTVGYRRHRFVAHDDLQRAVFTLRKKGPVPGWMTVAEAQRVLGYSRSNIQKLCLGQGIRSNKVQSRWYIDPSHVAELAATMRASGQTCLDWSRLSPKMAAYSRLQAEKKAERIALRARLEALYGRPLKMAPSAWCIDCGLKLPPRFLTKGRPPQRCKPCKADHLRISSTSKVAEWKARRRAEAQKEAQRA